MSVQLSRWRRAAAAGLLAGGLAAGAAVVAVPAQAATNLVPNGSAETVSRSVPKGWVKGGSGVNTRVQTSKSGGAKSGRKYVRAQVSQYRSGAAWWFTPPATVKGGATYTFSEYYRSSRPTVVNAYFTVGGKVVGSKVASLAAANGWKAASYKVTAPAGATKVRFGHALSSVGYVDVDAVSLVASRPATQGGATPSPSPSTTPSPSGSATAASTKGLVSFTFDDGWANQLTNAAPIMQAAGGMKGTFYLISGVLGTGSYLSVEQAKQLQSAGHELGSHTVSHLNLVNADVATIDRELGDSKTKLEGYFGAGSITDLAYPYGAGDAKVQAEAAKYYTSARSTNPGLNVRGQYNKYSLTIGYVLNTTSTSQVQQWLDEAKANNTWLVLCYHQVGGSDPNDPYNVSNGNFQAQVDAVKASGVRVATVRDALTATS